MHLFDPQTGKSTRCVLFEVAGITDEQQVHPLLDESFLVYESDRSGQQVVDVFIRPIQSNAWPQASKKVL